jgi:hypothetical protein
LPGNIQSKTPESIAEQFEKAKIELLNYAYSALDYHFGKAEKPQIPTGNGFINEKYYRLYLTLWIEGNPVIFAGNAPETDKYRIFKDIESASQQIANSLKKQPKNYQLVLDMLFDEYKLPKHFYPPQDTADPYLYQSLLLMTIKTTAELGTDAFRLDIPALKKSAVILPYEVIRENYSTTKTLVRLCEKLEMEETCYMNRTSDIYLYSVFSLTSRPSGKTYEMLRYNTAVTLSDINFQTLAWRIELLENWFYNNFDKIKNKPNYLYYPQKDEYDNTKNSHIRQLASLWVMAQVKNINDSFKIKGIINKIRHKIKQYKFGVVIKKIISDYLKYLYKLPDISYIKPSKRAVIAHNAFMILALCEFKSYPEWKQTAVLLADGIIAKQTPNGDFHTFFNSTRNTGQDYYPGEAILALMKLYEITKDPKYLNSVKKAFGYYSNYWRNNKTTAFVPWHTQAYYLLYKYTKTPEIADFIFEMNDWLINRYQIKQSHFDDKIGGFAVKTKYPSSYSYVFMEGILDAYKLALMLNDQKHIDFYRTASLWGIRYIMQSQFVPQNSFYFKNPYRIIGGFKSSILNNTIRIDNVQHAGAVLIKAYKGMDTE